MLKILRQRWQSRTYRAAIILAILSGIEASSGFITGHLPAILRPWIVMVWPLAMMILREMTTAALSEKGG